MSETFETDMVRKVLRLNARILILETQNAALKAALRDCGVTDDEITQLLENALWADDQGDDFSSTTSYPDQRA